MQRLSLTLPGAIKMGKTILFVYGTLKRGCRNHHLLAGQRFLGEACTERAYRLWDLGPYPGLQPAAFHGTSVQGELYEVDEEAMARLDQLEQVPDLYVRGCVRLDGGGRTATTYVYVGAVDGAVDSGDRWPA